MNRKSAFHMGSTWRLIRCEGVFPDLLALHIDDLRHLADIGQKDIDYDDRKGIGVHPGEWKRLEFIQWMLLLRAFSLSEFKYQPDILYDSPANIFPLCSFQNHRSDPKYVEWLSLVMTQMRIHDLIGESIDGI